MSLTQKRNIFGLLLVMLLTVPTLSTYLWLNYQIKEVKKEVKLKLKTSTPKEDLVKFTFTFKEFFSLDWKKKHEFKLYGKMYDVVYRELDGTTFTYWCWLDKEETALNAKLDHLLQIALSGNTKRKSKEYQLEIFLKSMIANCDNFVNRNVYTTNKIDLDVISFYKTIFGPLDSPPPKIA